MIESVNTFLSLGAIALLLVSLFVLVRLLLKKENDPVLLFVSKYALHIGLILSLASVIASLFYSEVAGFAPCTLCWFQRIFIYPQVILFGYALRKNDRNILSYAFILTLTGSLFALYHNYLYLGGTPAIPCDANASCTQRFVYEFGFMTIPLMALTLFIGLGVTYFVSRKFRTQ